MPVTVGWTSSGGVSFDAEEPTVEFVALKDPPSKGAHAPRSPPSCSGVCRTLHRVYFAAHVPTLTPTPALFSPG